MLHRLCGPPSIPLSFSLATVLPGGVLNALAAALRGGNPLTLSTHRLRRGLPGYLILFRSPRFRSSASVTDQSRLRHWCSSTSLRISPLHVEFHSPLLHSSSPVSNDPPRLSRGFHIRLKEPPASPLRPIIPDNACHLRITAAAGT